MIEILRRTRPRTGSIVRNLSIKYRSWKITNIMIIMLVRDSTVFTFSKRFLGSDPNAVQFIENRLSIFFNFSI
jgi:hypothetical protein